MDSDKKTQTLSSINLTASQVQQGEKPKKGTNSSKRATRLVSRRGFIAGTAILGLGLISSAYIYHEDSALEHSHYILDYPNLPEALHGYRIAHLSDLHNVLEQFKHMEADLIESVKAFDPSLICLTGDFIDKRDPELDRLHSFISSLTLIAPCCYVTGNHEELLKQKDPQLISGFLNFMKEHGVTVLDETEHYSSVYIGERQLHIVGIQDPLHYELTGGMGFWKDKLERLSTLSHYAPAASCSLAYLAPTADGGSRDEQDNPFEGLVIPEVGGPLLDRPSFSILLSHRPEYLNAYAEGGFNLILSGHTHGGQIRTPFGAIWAPGQGFFPHYDAGVFDLETKKKDSEDKSITGSKLVVSRGLGTSALPIRTFNRPELVLITLRRSA